MKKLITILVVISSLLVVGCSKPDFDENYVNDIKKIQRQLDAIEARIIELDQGLRIYTLADEQLYDVVAKLAAVLKGAILAEEMKNEEVTK